MRRGYRTTTVVMWGVFLAGGVLGCSAPVEPGSQTTAMDTKDSEEYLKVYDWRPLLLGYFNRPLDEITWIATSSSFFDQAPSPGALTSQERMDKAKATIYRLLGKGPEDAKSKSPALRVLNGNFIIRADATGHARLRGYQQACLDRRRWVRVKHCAISIPADRVKAFEALCDSLKKKGFYSADAKKKILAEIDTSTDNRCMKCGIPQGEHVRSMSVLIEQAEQVDYAVRQFVQFCGLPESIALNDPNGNPVRWLAWHTHGSVAIKDKATLSDGDGPAVVSTVYRRFRLLQAGDRPIYSLTESHSEELLPTDQWSMHRAKTTYWQATGVKPETRADGAKGHRVQTQKLSRKQVEKRLGKPLADTLVTFVMTRADVMPFDGPENMPKWLATYPDEFTVIGRDIDAGTFSFPRRRITLLMVFAAVRVFNDRHTYDDGYVEIIRPGSKDTRDILRFEVRDVLQGKAGKGFVIRRGDVLHFKTNYE